jgi:catechol 2,3-dioxygenase-like lactoylglutathione lyase family enzyme
LPRLIDKLDAATGRTPEVLDTGVDYLSQRPPPGRLIREDGTYDAGWFDAVPTQLNFQDSSAFEISFQRWFHLSFETPQHFLVLNIAHLGKAGNTAVLVCDKETGNFETASLTHILGANEIQVGPRAAHFHDPDSGSFVRVSDIDEAVEFSLCAEGLAVVGMARRILGPPLIQATGFQRGRGSFQRYGNLEIVHGTLAIRDRVLPLPAGSLGSFDRTMGHQRGLQNWNWLAAVGHAVNESNGQGCRLGIQVARDRDQARPVVVARKYAVWTEDVLHKVPEAVFEYTIDDLESRDSASPWRITSPGCKETWLDLTFTPRFHRREHRFLWLMKADFNQYYGDLSGRVRVGGQTYLLDPMFAVTEESLLEL